MAFSMKDFVQKIPSLVGAPNAEAYAHRNLLIYEDELKDGEGPFAHEKFSDPSERVSLMFGFSGDKAKIAHCEDICELAYLQHRVSAHNDAKYSKRVDTLMDNIAVFEMLNPEIAAVAPLADVATKSIWDN